MSTEGSGQILIPAFVIFSSRQGNVGKMWNIYQIFQWTEKINQDERKRQN